MSEILGIDIGVGSIKLVSVSKGASDKIILDAIGETKSPRVDWLKTEKSDKAITEMASALKLLLSDLKIKSKKVVTSLPEDEVVSRLIRLPPLKESEIRDALKFEAETFSTVPAFEARAAALEYSAACALLTEYDRQRAAAAILQVRQLLSEVKTKVFYEP